MHPLIERAKLEGRHLLEPEALRLLEEYGISIPRHQFARTETEVLEASKTLRWPVVMKVVSPDIIHKTEVGGVVLDIKNRRQAIKAFSQLMSLKDRGLSIHGVLICPFQDHGIEVSAGMFRDPQFGPVITFGLGGIWIEVFRDISYGLVPLSYKEAEEMITSIRGHSILEGIRGRMKADRQALCELLVCLSHLVMEEESIQEIDLNPLFPLERGLFIADARFILRL